MTATSSATPATRQPVNLRRSRARRRAGRFGTYLVAVLIGLFSVFPLFWMLLTSVKPRTEIVTRDPVFWPSSFAWDRYGDVLARGFTTYLANSLFIAVTVTLIGVLVAALAGYALARFDLPLKRYLLLVVLATQMFPVVVLLIPFFAVMRRLDLLDSYTGLIVTYMSFSIPLAIWILRGFFRGIPDELEDAALVDGCTRFGAMWRIVLPLAGPGIAACAIYVFIAAWNEFLFALTFTSSDAMRTLPVALQAFIGRDATDHGAIMAASTLFTLPVVVFFLFVHRRLTEGMANGAIKG
ncbi:carbohydrate ABC transporter permease [Egicoccus halophilus]|uniref:ABC transporter permease n=1 Tax=Egicoccus halophilus TaxID=1670830 RepID=A0A8J3ESY5_9ACTN|nr:carbohydrate ABC transporter permease [Egicoccus halophilus]GGI08412.1 ABC transporter permease [Egicoccus halophilus]